MENLEDFIKNNRDSMDVLRPSRKVWKGIRRDLHGHQPAILMRMAAAVLIIAVLTAAVVHYINNDHRSMSRADAMLMKANPQLLETEHYYNALANTLYQEAAPILAKNPDIKNELFTDMSQIDSICADIKKDLKDNVSNQEVIEALIRNYRIKIQILEDMLRELNNDKTKDQNNESHGL